MSASSSSRSLRRSCASTCRWRCSAGGSWSGLIAKNGYVASKDLALQQQASERAAALGWRLVLHEQDGHLLVERSGMPDGAVLDARVVRPVDETADRVLSLVAERAHRLRSADRLPRGNWIAVVRVAHGDASLERRLRIGGRP